MGPDSGGAGGPVKKMGGGKRKRLGKDQFRKTLGNQP